MNPKKIYNSLYEVHGIKLKQIKKYSRSKSPNTEIVNRELGLQFGSIWGVDDVSVPFDSKREKEHLKDAMRPCLALETPDSFEDYAKIEMAPGTSKEHPIVSNFPACLIFDNLNRELNQVTYFLLYLSWTSVQKKLRKRFGELSTDQKNLLKNIL